MLARLGYEPVGFQDSTAALASFHADPQRFDLVLTDEVMPEMTGTELATELHRIRPDLPIVLMTGYVESIPSRGLAAAGIREVLKKPLLSRPLATCVARYLPAKQAAEHRTQVAIIGWSIAPRPLRDQKIRVAVSCFDWPCRCLGSPPAFRSYFR